MSSPYRTRLRACPSCREPMRKVSVRAVQADDGGIDLCDACGGVFLEFFDGEPSAVSREVAAHVAHFESELRVGAEPLSCPDCDREMEIHPYLDEGPNLARCNRCMAVFANVGEVRALSEFSLTQEPRGWFERLVSFLVG